MTAWRFVHAADLHLDSPFAGLRNYREKLARELTAATFTALQRLVDLCLENAAEFLFPGRPPLRRAGAQTIPALIRFPAMKP